jgi:hypothetical protein
MVPVVGIGGREETDGLGFLPYSLSQGQDDILEIGIERVGAFKGTDQANRFEVIEIPQLHEVGLFERTVSPHQV